MLNIKNLNFLSIIHPSINYSLAQTHAHCWASCYWLKTNYYIYNITSKFIKTKFKITITSDKILHTKYLF